MPHLLRLRRANSSRLEQHLGGGTRRAGDGRVATHEGSCESTFGEDLKLGGERVRVFHAQALEQRAEPEAALFLELNGDPARGVPGIAELGHGVDERAAAEIGAGEDALEAVEGAEDLFAGRSIRGRERPEARSEVGRDQRVLGRVVVVEGSYSVGWAALIAVGAVAFLLQWTMDDRPPSVRRAVAGPVPAAA